MYEIRKIHSNEVTETLTLALEVFCSLKHRIINQRGLIHSNEM